MHTALLKQFELARSLTLHALESVGEEAARTIPAGFSNNILWNAGHLLVSAEQLLAGVANDLVTLPQEYKGLFLWGTKPADWTGEPPSLETIIRQLKEQQDWVITQYGGRLAEEMPEPFQIREAKMVTYADLLVFLTFHEGMHLGYIKAINRTLSAAT